jgi:hypothetical protein
VRLLWYTGSLFGPSKGIPLDISLDLLITKLNMFAQATATKGTEIRKADFKGSFSLCSLELNHFFIESPTAHDVATAPE